MKKWIVAPWALVMFVTGHLQGQTLVANFDSLAFWTGTGTNRAALVLDFDAGDSRVSVAWGYRWNGPAVMQDMLFALAGSITGSDRAPSPQPGSDARLSVEVGYFAGLGLFVSSLAFDARGLGGSWPDAQLRIQNDFFETGTYPAVYLRPGNGTWTSQPFDFSTEHGVPTLPLEDGGWFGIVQSQGEETFDFSLPYAAPAGEAVPIPVPVTIAEKNDAGASVSILSTVGFYYQLQANTTLANSGWTDIGSAIAGHGQVLSLSDPDADAFPRRFYRIVISR